MDGSFLLSEDSVKLLKSNFLNASHNLKLFTKSFVLFIVVVVVVVATAVAAADDNAVTFAEVT